MWSASDSMFNWVEKQNKLKLWLHFTTFVIDMVHCISVKSISMAKYFTETLETILVKNFFHCNCARQYVSILYLKITNVINVLT